MKRLEEEDLRMLIRLRSAVALDDLVAFFNAQKLYYANELLTAEPTTVPKLQGAGIFIKELIETLKNAPVQLQKLEQSKKGNT